MINKYIEYLKDNPKGYWFKRKLYGWGWTPATREGWLVTLIFMGLLLWNGYTLESYGVVTNDVLIWFYIKMVLLIGGILIIGYHKGEPLKWQWGYPDVDKER